MFEVSAEQTRNAAERAIAFAQRNDFAGRDPYDGLLSPLSRLLPSRIPRQALVQIVKRSGERTRQALGIPKVRMSKSVALFSMAAFYLGDERLANELGDDLVTSANGGPWGYEFDVQTRWAHYPAGSPNVIATAFAVRALALLGRTSDVSGSTLEWLLSLRRGEGYFAYTPMSDRLIHNGNLLAAESILRLGGDVGAVSKAVEISRRAQRADGSWPYGEGPGLGWVDNFHTAYVLDCLRYLTTMSFEVSEPLERGSRYWLDTMFTKSGLALYFPTSKNPSQDLHNVATAVATLADMDKDRVGDRHRSATYLLDFQGQDGAFRKTPSAPAFMRWNQAHASYALAKWMRR